MLKRILQRTLPAKYYKGLLRLRYEALPVWRYNLGHLPFLLAGTAIKVTFPDKSLVSLKSSINVVKKIDYPGRDIYLAVDSDFEYRVRLHASQLEPETVEWIENYLKEGEVLYDVGANTGAYSLIASKHLNGKVTACAFEPSFLNFTQLCKNLAGCG